ncbi:MAG: inorganic phosphate transporter [Parachlamydiaceae bacterium]|nr:inorganic phosphate transporter [Parachlamydiaceae bacterium]
MSPDSILMFCIILAGFYMAWNIGANDVANAMGTSVGSGALTLKKAVYVAAILEFSGAFFFGSNVSETIQRGIIDVSTFDYNPMLLVYGMFSVLIAAGAWLQLASYYGWPVSTTHTIVGAVVGFGIIGGSIDAIHWSNVASIVLSWAISPLAGGILSFLIFTFLRHSIFYRPYPLDAAKRITPFLVFGVIMTLSVVLIFNGLNNLDLGLTLWEALLWSILPSTLGALVCWLLVRKMSLHSSYGHHKSGTHAVVIDEIEQAQHHLLQAFPSFPNEIQDRLSAMVEEIDHLKPAIKKVNKNVPTESQYAAIEKIFAYLQIMSACLMAFAHGANDVANAIGPLSAAISTLQTGTISAYAPIAPWILGLGGVGIVIGLATWGWRVIETIGKKITELTPTRGFAAEFGAATTIVIASQFGMPISTTHTLVGSVLGVGLARGIEALNLAMTRDIFISWLVTVPAGAGATVIIFYILKSLFL